MKLSSFFFLAFGQVFAYHDFSHPYPNHVGFWFDHSVDKWEIDFSSNPSLKVAGLFNLSNDGGDVELYYEKTFTKSEKRLLGEQELGYVACRGDECNMGAKRDDFVKYYLDVVFKEEHVETSVCVEYCRKGTSSDEPIEYIMLSECESLRDGFYDDPTVNENIVIHSALINTEGNNERNDEWIELENKGEWAGMKGWTLSDGIRRSISFDNGEFEGHGNTRIQPLKTSEGQVMLSNKKGTLYLRKPNGALASKVSWEYPKEGEVVYFQPALVKKAKTDQSKGEL